MVFLDFGFSVFGFRFSVVVVVVLFVFAHFFSLELFSDFRWSYGSI